VRRVVALTLAMLFFSSSAGIVNGQSEDKITLIEENIDYEGPFWYSVSCLKVSCPGLTIEINGISTNYSSENDHLLEWAGVLSSGASLKISSESSISLEDISTQMIKVNEFSIVENEDLIDSIPSQGNQENYYTILTSDICSLGNCDLGIKDYERQTEFIGILDNYSDKDSIKIGGEFGDVIEISELYGDQHLRVEVWHRNEQGKLLINNDLLESGSSFLEYPEDYELWLRINSDSNKELYPYKFTIYRNNQSIEAPLGGELSVPWNHGEALTYHDSWHYESYISKSDRNGDSILFRLGADAEVGLLCSSSNNNMIFEIFLIKYDSTLENISLENGTCPEIIVSDENTEAIELRIKTEETGKWNISFIPIRKLDAGKLSDAPELRWLIQPDKRWTEIKLDSEITGSLHSSDNIDIYLIRILDQNGSRVYLNQLIKSEVNYTIQEIDQDTGLLVNTSNGETIVLPYGNHSFRIERRADQGIEIDYTFKLEYLGEYEEPEIEDYEDLSWMFDNFYKLIGVLFLTPLMIVIFWNRKAIINRGKITKDIQLHDMERLIRIRDRLSRQLNKNESKDENIIDSALKQLGESPWNSINEVWGKPILTHMTEQIDICAWKITENEKNLLLGIKAGNCDWEMAAMKIHFPEGSKLTITDVSPKHIFQDDEIFLDTIKSNSQIFIRISISGENANLGLQFSGLVNGEPLVAAPNKIINW